MEMRGRFDGNVVYWMELLLMGRLIVVVWVEVGDLLTIGKPCNLLWSCCKVVVL